MKRYYLALFSLISLAPAIAIAAGDDFRARLRAAETLNQGGDYGGAEKILLAALQEAEKFAPDDPRKAIVWQNLGTVYDFEGRYREAEANFLAARRFWTRTRKPNDILLVRSIISLATLYVETGQSAKAERLSLKSLAARLEESTRETPDLARLLDTLGSLAHLRGRTGDAEVYYRRSLALWERIGPTSLEVLETLNNLGVLYQDMRRTREALGYYERAFRVAEVALPPAHPERVKLLANLGVLNFIEHGPTAAEPYFRDALSIGERALGSSHPMLGQILLSYSVILEKAKRKSEARQCHRRAEAILAAASEQDPKRHTVDVSDLLRQPVGR